MSTPTSAPTLVLIAAITLAACIALGGALYEALLRVPLMLVTSCAMLTALALA